MLKDKLRYKIKNYLLNKNLVLDNLELRKDFEVEFLAQGEYNINFTIKDKQRKYVFRVNTGSQLQIENQIQYEHDALKRLEISGVTPRVHFVDGTKTSMDYGILIMEFLNGKPLDYTTDLEKGAKIFGKIHSINTSSINTDNFIVENNIFTDRVIESKRLLKDYLNSPIISRENKRFMNSFLDWAIKNSSKEIYFTKNKWHVINNTEVNSHNFIIGKEKSYLIDWEKPVISDPCQDLTQFLATTTTLWKTDIILTKEDKEKFFECYVNNLDGGDKDIRDRVNLYTPYLYLRALSWCAYAWLEYQNPQKDIKNLDTLKKVETYLNIDFMKELLKDYI